MLSSLVELEYKAYWALKLRNIDYSEAGTHRFLILQELDDLRLEAYESSITYKEEPRSGMINELRILGNL
jgi:hypothetical protein